jgi:hypothetical protein
MGQGNAMTHAVGPRLSRSRSASTAAECETP